MDITETDEEFITTKKTDCGVSCDLSSLCIEQQLELSNPQELLCIPDSVRIYYILTRANFIIPSKPAPLRILKIPPNTRNGFTVYPPVLIQVGEWKYPLSSGKSCVFKSREGNFIFRNLAAAESSFVCLTLGRTVDAMLRHQFEEALLSLTGISHFPRPASSTIDSTIKAFQSRKYGSVIEKSSESIGVLSRKIIVGMMAGAQMISKGLISAASATSGFIKLGTQYIKKSRSFKSPSSSGESLDGSISTRNLCTSNPTGIYSASSQALELNFPEALKENVSSVKAWTERCMDISEFIVGKLGGATENLAKCAAFCLRSNTKARLETTFDISGEEAEEIMNRVFDVTHGALASTAIVYCAIDTAAFTIARAVADNSLQLIREKYGDEARKIIEDAIETAGNIALLGIQGMSFEPTQVIKKAIKETGKVIMQEMESENERKNNFSSRSDQS